MDFHDMMTGIVWQRNFAFSEKQNSQISKELSFLQILAFVANG
jgi:hypothetical protein